MRINVDRAILISALAACNTIKGAGTTSREDLVRIVARPGLVSLDASNAEQHAVAVYESPDAVVSAGEVAVDRALLTSIIRRAQPGSILLSTDGTSLAITDSEGEWRLTISDAEALPVPPMSEACPGILVPIETWQRAISYALRAVARESARFTLCGVSISCTPKYYEIAGTDGRRAHRARIAMAVTDAQKCPAVIAPAAWCHAASRLAGMGDVHYQADANSVSVTIQGAGGVTSTLSSRLIEGRFPSISAVWPPANKITATATAWASELIAAHGALAPAAGSEGKRVSMVVGATIVLSASCEAAQASRIIAASRADDAPSAKIDYNLDYMLGAIDGMEGEIEMRIISESHPMELALAPIVSEGAPELSISAIVMPLA